MIDLRKLLVLLCVFAMWLVASTALAQTVKVQTQSADRATKFYGSGVVVHSSATHGTIIVTSGHQFRDYSGAYPIIADKHKATLLYSHVDKDGEDIAILKTHIQLNIPVAVLAETPATDTRVYCHSYRDEMVTGMHHPNGYTVGDTRYRMKGNFGAGQIANVTRGYSGGAVYLEKAKSTFIGVVSLSGHGNPKGTTYDRRDVLWTKSEVIAERLKQVCPELYGLAKIEPRVVYVVGYDGCAHCELLKSDDQRKLFGARNVYLQYVDKDKSATHEVFQQVRADGHQVPQRYPWFYTKGQTPQTGYTGFNVHLGWLPPPIFAPGGLFGPPRHYSRQRPPATALTPPPRPDIPRPLPVTPVPDDRVDGLISQVNTLRGLFDTANTNNQTRFDEVTNNTATQLDDLRGVIGAPGEGGTPGSGIFNFIGTAIKTSTEGLGGDVAASVSASRYGAGFGLAGMAASAAAALFMRRIGRRIEKKLDARDTVVSTDNGQTGTNTGQQTGAGVLPVPIRTKPHDQQVIHSTQFAEVQVDDFNQAYAWARGQMVGVEPGSAGNLDALDSMIKQYLSAKRKVT
jgi:hypothetical protein